MPSEDMLQKRLIDIEKALGGDGDLPDDYYYIDKLDWHLLKIESLIEGGSGGW